MLPRLLAPAIACAILAAALLSAGDAEAARVYTTRTNVDTTPAGAEVYLIEAGGDKLLGISPLTNAKLPRGIIKLRFSKDGYEPLTETLDIGRSRKSYVFNLVRTVVPATLEFIGSPEVAGAAITVDGQAQGQVPGSVTLTPGRHHAVVEKAGFERWERWVEVTENQKVSFDVVLKTVAAAPGELLITSNPSGGDIRVNGAPRGKTPTVIEQLAPGQYLVEVVLEGHQSFGQTVAVETGKRTIIDAQLAKTQSALGELKVLSTQPNTTILVDGEEAGIAPVTKAGLKPGLHIVEGRSLDGAQTSQQVEVRGGEQVVVRLELAAAPKPADTARVRVIANVPGAHVDIDGIRQGPSPFVAEDLDAGTHWITVSAEGYATWKKSVSLAIGDNPEVVAELGQAGQIEVQTRAGDAAEVFANGKPIGRTPYAGQLPVGTHNILVKRADGTTEEFRVAVGMERLVRITAAFGEEDPNAVAEETRSMPWSARAMQAGKGALDVFSGWPFLFGFAAGGGVGSGIDIGVQARFAFTAINELEAVVQWTYAQTNTVAASIEAGIGGGLGADERNSFGFRLTARGSVLIGTRAAITATFGMLAYTDRLGPESVFARRDDGARLRLGLAIEVAITDDLNLFLNFEGDPMPGNRHILAADYLVDGKMYGNLGVSWAF